MKFYYGFVTKFESYAVLFRTNNYLLGMLFADWFEDPKLKLNGSEWTTLYYLPQFENLLPDYKVER
jgi:hypothetical protein